ncbi:MAG: electron transport complex subunit RsxC [Myxococcales bacterium]|nr:electron transport complex subunit RsxC [Myxococcales bacterium]
MRLARLRSFRHGVHPDGHKTTADVPTRRMPFVERYVLPLGQHIGAPAKPVVSVGQHVARGEMIAAPGAFVSTALHAPVAGRIAAIAERRDPTGRLANAIEIEADPFSTQAMPTPRAVDADALTDDEFVALVQHGGLVGLGGAAFPSHVKYAPTEGKPVEWLVLNGAECEPFLTADHRLMLERPQDVVRGATILAKRLSAGGIKIGVELNKGDAVQALRDAAAEALAAGEAPIPIEVVGLQVKYPQGAEKMLIKAIFEREVPAGKLPLDIGIVVNNVGTIAALADLVDRGWPLIERIVTVAGPGIGEPSNLIVPIGTPVSAVIRHCHVRGETRELIMGGPMMGQPLASSDVPVVKGTSGLLAFTEAELTKRHEYTCVRCGRCLDACANMLNPARLARLARARRYDELEASFVTDCMECGACSYTCPSGLPIVQLIRAAKAAVRTRKKDKN